MPKITFNPEPEIRRSEGSIGVYTTDTLAEMSVEELRQRIADLESHFEMTSMEVVLRAESGTLPTEPHFAEWLVLLDRGDLITKPSGDDYLAAAEPPLPKILTEQMKKISASFGVPDARITNVLEMSCGNLDQLPPTEPSTRLGIDLCERCAGETKICHNCGWRYGACTCRHGFDPVVCPECDGTGKEVGS